MSTLLNDLLGLARQEKAEKAEAARRAEAERAAGGLPMIWEYVEDHTAAAAAADLRRHAAEIQRVIGEER